MSWINSRLLDWLDGRRLSRLIGFEIGVRERVRSGCFDTVGSQNPAGSLRLAFGA